MGKRHGESRQASPNRARSKNDPDGKGNDHQDGLVLVQQGPPP